MFLARSNLWSLWVRLWPTSRTLADSGTDFAGWGRRFLVTILDQLGFERNRMVLSFFKMLISSSLFPFAPRVGNCSLAVLSGEYTLELNNGVAI